MPTTWLSDYQRYGAIFCYGGTFVLICGVVLLFDYAMLAMGNILLLIGVTLSIGPARTITYFTDCHRIPGTSTIAAGMLLISFKWPLIGFVIEIFGLFMLFGDFILWYSSFFRGVGPYIEMPMDGVPDYGWTGTLPI